MGSGAAGEVAISYFLCVRMQAGRHAFAGGIGRYWTWLCLQGAMRAILLVWNSWLVSLNLFSLDAYLLVLMTHDSSLYLQVHCEREREREGRGCQGHFLSDELVPFSDEGRAREGGRRRKHRSIHGDRSAWESSNIL